jgi:hypothetical protein
MHRNNPHVNQYGKAAIVKSILEAERQSALYFDPARGIAGFDTRKIANTWFVKFMHMLGRGIAKEDIRQIFNNVSFIAFNYDRCLEHFLPNALAKLYAIPEREASDIVAELRIIHPYGVVADDAPFGADRANYLTLAGSIKTYTEQAGATDITSQLGADVGRADCIVFLGFAYHSQNMMMLRPPKPVNQKFLYGTAYKMSDADVDVVSQQITKFFTPTLNERLRALRIRLESKLKSADLFDYYAKSLSGGD